ncbi:unnamed protein product [Heterobilharzia americana]|nr:unnamed protein product [Heterobilharzia americana]
MHFQITGIRLSRVLFSGLIWWNFFKIKNEIFEYDEENEFGVTRIDIVPSSLKVYIKQLRMLRLRCYTVDEYLLNYIFPLHSENFAIMNSEHNLKENYHFHLLVNYILQITTRYQRLAKTIKGVSLTDNDCLSTDQGWICAMCSLRSIHKRYLALARLSNPVNFGRSSEGTYLIVLIITPTKEKGTKSEIEVGRTFATILADPEFRQEILFANNENEVKLLLWERAQQLAVQQSTNRRRSSQFHGLKNLNISMSSQSMIGKGIYSDLKRKIPYYWSDITEGCSNTLTFFVCLSSFNLKSEFKSHHTGELHEFMSGFVCIPNLPLTLYGQFHVCWQPKCLWISDDVLLNSENG